MQMWHLCQEVCPFNRLTARSAHPTLVQTDEPAFQPREATTVPRLTDLLTMTEEGFREKFRGSPVKRAKWQGLRRNTVAACPAEIPARKVIWHKSCNDGL
jgi:epoxyqueuosine reductase